MTRKAAEHAKRVPFGTQETACFFAYVMHSKGTRHTHSSVRRFVHETMTRTSHRAALTVTARRTNLPPIMAVPSASWYVSGVNGPYTEKGNLSTHIKPQLPRPRSAVLSLRATA